MVQFGEEQVTYLTATEVARKYNKDPSVVIRWMIRGVRGEVLTSKLIGGRRFTTPEWLDDFDRRLNADTPEVAAATEPRKPARKTRSASAAGRLVEDFVAGRRPTAAAAGG